MILENVIGSTNFSIFEEKCAINKRAKSNRASPEEKIIF